MFLEKVQIILIVDDFRVIHIDFLVLLFEFFETF